MQARRGIYEGTSLKRNSPAPMTAIEPYAYPTVGSWGVLFLMSEVPLCEGESDAVSVLLTPN